MKKKICQSIANWIIKQMDKTTNYDVILFYHDMGMTLDNICTYSLDIELD
jgi:hypothetical protein